MSLCNMDINAYRSGGFNKPDFIFSGTHGSEKKKGFHLTFSSKHNCHHFTHKNNEA